jgi:type I restriction enzyme S subunit
MELKKGYKQTGVGLIPEDWNVVPINSVASVKTGPFGSALHEKDYVQEGTPIITVEHLGEQGVVHSDLPMVSGFDLQRLHAYSLQSGDIVFSRVGSVDRNSLIGEKEHGWLFSGRLLRIRAQSKNLHTPFLSYYFHSEPFKQRVRGVAVGQTMASLNTKIVNAIEVVMPPLSEQRAIAAALTDVDALLTALDALIAKKRAIKQGAMQELLAGKRRLAGFSNKWDEKQLGEIGALKKGRNIPRKNLSTYGVACVLYGEIYTKYNDVVEKLDSRLPQESASQATPIRMGDILFAGSGETAEDIGKCFAYLGDEEACAGGDLIILTPEKDDSRFLGYLLNAPIVAKQKAILAQGVSVFHIYASSLKTIRVLLPSLVEQQAIAEVLSDMDADIAAVETRREKTRMLKQGMMQELLTGRIRLV